MNFELSDEQVQIRDTFARFCDERIAPRAAAIDEAHAFPRELFGEVAALGFFGLRYPPESGGLGLDLISLCLALEEISRGSMSLAGCVTMQSLMGTKFLDMLGNADTYISNGQWWLVYPVGLCLVAVVMAWNMVGDALRDALDVRLQRR